LFGILDVYTAIDASSAASGWLGVEKKKEVLRTLSANWENSMRSTGRRSGLRWTPVDARDRAGPATLDSHGSDATRRLGVAGP